MKKVFLFFFAIIYFHCILLAQNNNSTLKFMGIPLGVPFSEFKQEMLSKGFKFNEEESNSARYGDIYLFKGRFAGENVGVSVFVTSHSHFVYSVNIRFVDYNNPHDMTEEAQRVQLYIFNKIRESVLKKYKIEPDDWSIDNIIKASTWETPKWSIILTLGYETTSCYKWQTIDLIYTDKNAERKAEIEKESDF